MNVLCPFCKNEVKTTDKYCSLCGKRVDGVNLSISSKEKVKIYLLSILLTPIGLFWFFKYFRNSDSEKRKTAYVSLAITVVMVIILIVINIYFFEMLKDYLGSYEKLMYGF